MPRPLQPMIATMTFSFGLFAALSVRAAPKVAIPAVKVTVRFTNLRREMAVFTLE